MPWVELYRFHHPLEAELAKSYLEAHGIEVYLLQEGAARAIGIYIPPFGTIRLLVPESQRREAQQLLHDFLLRARGEYGPEASSSRPDAS